MILLLIISALSFIVGSIDLYEYYAEEGRDSKSTNEKIELIRTWSMVILGLLFTIISFLNITLR